MGLRFRRGISEGRASTEYIVQKESSSLTHPSLTVITRRAHTLTRFHFPPPSTHENLKYDFTCESFFFHFERLKVDSWFFILQRAC